MARADATERQALWQLAGAERDSCIHADYWHLHPVYDEEEKKLRGTGERYTKCCSSVVMFTCLLQMCYCFLTTVGCIE